MFPHKLLDHAAFHALSPRAVKAMMFLASQYRGTNNGDLCIARKVLEKAGLKHSRNMQLAVQELIDSGFVIQSRQGGKNRCSLFALTWFPIHECDGKLDIAERTAPIEWSKLGILSGSPVNQCGSPVNQSAQSGNGNPLH
jgi:hypothetical protein